MLFKDKSDKIWAFNFHWPLIASNTPRRFRSRGAVWNFENLPGFSKLVHWNEREYCTPIDRALKIRFNEISDSFLRATIFEFGKFF